MYWTSVFKSLSGQAANSYNIDFASDCGNSIKKILLIISSSGCCSRQILSIRVLVLKLYDWPRSGAEQFSLLRRHLYIKIMSVKVRLYSSKMAWNCKDESLYDMGLRPLIRLVKQHWITYSAITSHVHVSSGCHTWLSPPWL